MLFGKRLFGGRAERTEAAPEVSAAPDAALPAAEEAQESFSVALPLPQQAAEPEAPQPSAPQPPQASAPGSVAQALAALPLTSPVPEPVRPDDAAPTVEQAVAQAEPAPLANDTAAPAPGAAADAAPDPAAGEEPETAPQTKALPQPGPEPLVHIRPAAELVDLRFFIAVSLLCLAAIAGAAGWGLFNATGPAIVGDEIGYWGNAAVLAGQDWRSVMARLPFYGYGYSLLLVPLFWLGLPMQQMYQLALAGNILLLWLAFMLSYLCLRRLFSALTPLGALLVAGAATLYANNVVQAQCAWSETALYTFYWLLFWLVLRLLDKPTLPCVLALSVTAGYLYMIHLRSLGVLLALVLVMLLFTAARRLSWRHLLAFGLSFAAMLALQNGIKLWFNHNVYVGTATSGANDYGSQLANLINAFTTAEGFSTLLLSVCGKLFYLGVATLLLGYAALQLLFADGLGALWQWARGGFRQLNARRLPSLFLLLSFGGTFMVAAISIRGVAADRLDLAVYGRYMEFTFGPLIAIGLALLVLGRVRLGHAVALGGALVAVAIPVQRWMAPYLAEPDAAFHNLCVTALRSYEQLFGISPLLPYAMALSALVLFFLMWGCQYAFGHYVELHDLSPRQLRGYRLARPALRVVLPLAVCVAFWLSNDFGENAVASPQRGRGDMFAPFTTLLQTANAVPDHLYLVLGPQGDQEPLQAALVQTELPYTLMTCQSVAEFNAASPVPTALYITSAAYDDADDAVAESCAPLFSNDAFTLYATPDSVWYAAAQQMPLQPARQSVAFTLEESARVPSAATGGEEPALRTALAWRQREDGRTETVLPVGITSSGEEGAVLHGPGVSLPAGQYEVGFTLTLAENAAGAVTLGRLSLLHDGGTYLFDRELAAADYPPGSAVRATLQVSTMLDQLLTGVHFQFYTEAGVRMTLEEITLTRLGEANEVVTADTPEMDQLRRLLELDYENLPFYVLARPSQQGRASVQDLQRAFPEHNISLESDLGKLHESPGILLIPTSRQTLIYQLLGRYLIAERLGNYTLLLPVGSGLEGQFTAHGGAPLNDGYGIDLRYWADGDDQPANSVTAVPPAGQYEVRSTVTFSNVLVGSYGTLQNLVDDTLRERIPLQADGENFAEDGRFISITELTLDGTQALTYEVDSGPGAQLQNLQVTLRRLSETAATYGDP